MKKKKRKPLDLDKLEKWLEEVEMPDTIVLDAASVIRSPDKFFKSHITLLRGGSSPKRIKDLHEDRIRVAIKYIQNELEDDKK